MTVTYSGVGGSGGGGGPAQYLAAPGQGTGGLDDGATVQAFINAGVTNFVLGPASQAAPFKWSTIPKIPIGGSVTVKGSGRLTTFVQLSAGAPRFIDPNKTADYQTFGFDVSNLTIDDNNVGGNNGIFGNYQNGTNVPRVNWVGCWMTDVDVINFPTNANCQAFVVQTGMSAADPAQSRLTDVYIRGCRCFGGRAGFGVSAVGPATAGFVTFIDRVRITECYHDTGIIPSAAPAGAWGNFDMIANGTGGSDIEVRNCIGKGSNDVGVQWDGSNYALMDGVDIYDAWNNAFLLTSFQLPAQASGVQYATPLAQQWVLRNCRSFAIGTLPNAGAFQVENQNSNPMGRVLFDNCVAYVGASPNTVASPTVWNWSVGVNATQCKIIGVTWRNCRAVMDGWTSPTTAVNVYFCSLSPAPAIGAVLPVMSFEGTNEVYTHATQGGAGTFTYRGLCLNQGSCAITGAGEFTFDHNVTSQTVNSTAMFLMGLNTSTVKGVLPRLRVLSCAGGDTTPKGMSITGTPTLTITDELMVKDCDFRSLPGTATDVFRGTSNGARVKFVNNKWLVFPKLPLAMAGANFTTPTFTTAVWNQYIGGSDAVILMTGGAAITAIDISPDNGTTIVNVLTQASGALAAPVTFMIWNAWYVRVTFATTQPVTTVIYNA